MTALSLFLADDDATARLGNDLAAALRPGDLVALHGDLGAGKTALARAIIRSLAADPALDVPSPTFTLVQDYTARFPVHHFDLYRLSSPDELEELGYDEAREAGVCLVEWPERAAGRLGADGMDIVLAEENGGRRVAISGSAHALARIGRSFSIRGFLDLAGWAGARRSYLQGDASARAYERVELPDRQPVILMNSPRQPDGPPIRGGRPYSRIAKLAESVVPFVAIDRALREHGFAAPEIHAQDLDAGLLLIENLGSATVLDKEGKPVRERYEAAAGLLADMHAVDWPRALPVAEGMAYPVPDYDAEAMLIETELLLDWYVPRVTGEPASAADREAFAAAWAQTFDLLERSETSLVLRDFHSPNLIWRETRNGNDRLGVIDFQDALIGPAAYDVASLAMDARVDMTPELEQAVVDAYCAARMRSGPFDREAFEVAYAIMAAQRNSKILGIFVRLDARDGKPHYLRHLPRIGSYLARALAHPALSPVRELYTRLGLLEGPAS